MKVLVACEESQTVCKAFRARGHEAYSCDIQPCSGGHPEWHIQDDVLEHIYGLDTIYYDRIISFPPCTDIAVSGSRWFKDKRLSGQQEKSINFFLDVWEFSDVLENPIGIMSGERLYLKKWFPLLYDRSFDLNLPTHPEIIQPWEFGHTETKATCIFRRGRIFYDCNQHDCQEEDGLCGLCGPGDYIELPALKSTDNVGPPPPIDSLSLDEAMEVSRMWNKVHRYAPGPERSKLRSRTYPGIAKAMAEQWG